MKSAQKLLKALLVAQLFYAPFALAGTMDAGGGTEKNQQMMDGYTILNTWHIRSTEAYAKLTGPVLRELTQRLPTFAQRLKMYSENKRFVAVDADELPPLQAGDAKHFLGDKLVAIQRGPIIWFLRKDINALPVEEQGLFQLHELVVADRLAQGLEIDERAKDEVLSMTAALADMAISPKEMSARRLRQEAESYHFVAGLTQDELVQLGKDKAQALSVITTYCNSKGLASFGSAVPVKEKVLKPFFSTMRNSQNLYSPQYVQAFAKMMKSELGLSYAIESYRQDMDWSGMLKLQCRDIADIVADQAVKRTVLNSDAEGSALDEGQN